MGFDLVLVGLAVLVPILVAFALTVKRKPMSQKDVFDIMEGLKTPEETSELARSQARSPLGGLGRKSRGAERDMRESLVYREARADEELHIFLNPAEFDATYMKLKTRVTLIMAAFLVPIALFMVVVMKQPFFIVLAPMPILGWGSVMLLQSSRRKKMQKQVVELIPDLLGYLSAFVTQEAELVRPLEMILTNDTENANSILYASIREAMTEARVGGDFYAVLQEQANLLAVDEWKSVVFMLNQSRRIKGKDVREIIREVEADFREERKLRLEMAASQVTTKLSVISSLLFIPAIYVYTMAPAYMKLFSTPGFL